MNTQKLRVQIARYIMAIDAEVKYQQVSDTRDINSELFFAKLFSMYTDEKINERIKDEVRQESNLGHLESCVRDYNIVPTYLSVLSEIKLPITFQIQGKKGILIEKGKDKYLILLSSGLLAEISSLDANGSVCKKSTVKDGITFDEAIKQYGTDENLARQLESNIGRINLVIQKAHKHMFPKLYTGGGHIYATDADLIRHIEAVDKINVSENNALLGKQQQAEPQQ
ncbi:MAG TPA: hypothetical protein PLA87_12965 [Pseudomonadota bacterium]|nr:hypothetical protein [Pseudomonadota bacterium]